MRTIFLIILATLSLYAHPTELSVELVKQHEGYSSIVYKDSHGYAIGYGTNLSYITKKEAIYLLKSRIQQVDRDLNRIYPWYSKLPYVPKSLIIDMAYSTGVPRFTKFHKMHRQLSRHNWVKAALEMRASLWYKQTKGRGRYLFNAMRNYKN